jgi:hypothetical protein
MVCPTIQLVLWVSQPIPEAARAYVMFRRKLHQDFPTFFFFQVVQIAFFVVEFSLNRWGSYAAYFYTYWSFAAINLGLAFKIIHEVFLDVFRPYHALKDLGSALFKWTSVVMLLVSVVLVSLRPGWQDPLAETVLITQRCVRIIQCGMFFFLLAFCKSLGVSWRRQSFGIILGFGVFAVSELLTVALFSGSHINIARLNVVNMTAYDLSLGLWLGYSLLNRREVSAPILVPQRWDEALMDIQPRRTSESLIPMFEHMVDRALSKAHEHTA